MNYHKLDNFPYHIDRRILIFDQAFVQVHRVRVDVYPGNKNFHNNTFRNEKIKSNKNSSENLPSLKNEFSLFISYDIS